MIDFHTIIGHTIDTFGQSVRGELKIAEVSSRITDMEAFVSVISAVGFKLKSKVGF